MKLSLLFLGALLASAPTFASPNGKTVLVQIENMKFSPSEIHIKKGETVTWVNHDLVPHTVTSENKTFDSKTIDPGKTWSLKPTKTGTHPYKCSFHPTMSGSFIVDKK